VVEGEEMTPMVFLLVFAFLALAILAIRQFVRSGDVLHGGYIEDPPRARPAAPAGSDSRPAPGAA
jgi:hypothetical protein